jgi:hypothetical protein
VDTQYDADTAPQVARQIFPAYRDLSVSGMPLRAIFVALAKKER